MKNLRHGLFTALLLSLPGIAYASVPIYIPTCYTCWYEWGMPWWWCQLQFLCPWW